MKKQLNLLENKLDFKFKDISLLRNALVHRSYLNEHKDFVFDQNERLEFLGDAVLELAVTDYLYRNYTEAEGILTNWRSSLVNGDRLASIAEALGVYDFMYLSKGESQDGNKKARQYILANAYEAVIGAIYLDSGYESAKGFINKYVLKELADIIENKTYRDAKSLFQERAQEKVGITPTYEVLEEWGPDHARNFKVGVFIEKEMAGQGEGPSKQEAQQVAAEDALKKKGW